MKRNSNDTAKTAPYFLVAINHNIVDSERIKEYAQKTGLRPVILLTNYYDSLLTKEYLLNDIETVTIYDHDAIRSLVRLADKVFVTPPNEKIISDIRAYAQ